MKAVFPVVFTKLEDGYMAYVPDMQLNTQGDNLAEAIEMARDAIGIMGIDMEDENESIPMPSELSAIVKERDGDIVNFVDVDFTEYRRRNDMRTVRRNVSLPSWLNAEADRAGVNVSAILQNALKQQLQITD